MQRHGPIYTVITRIAALTGRNIYIAHGRLRDREAERLRGRVSTAVRRPAVAYDVSRKDAAMKRRGTIACDRCGQRSGRRGHGDWIVTTFAGWAVAYVCPPCQTAEEHAEAAANEALLSYRRDHDEPVLTSPRVTT